MITKHEDSTAARRLRAPHALLVTGALALTAFGAGCGDDADGGSADAGRPDTSTTPAIDGGARADSSAADSGTVDSGNANDAATVDVSDAAAVVDASDGGASAKAVILPLANGRHARLYSVVYTAAGIYAVGQAGEAAAPADLATIVVKLLPSGALDTTFGTGGIASKNVAVGAAGEIARGIVVQSNGKIVVAGVAEHAAAIDPTRDLTLVRFNANGAIDTTFGTAGVARIVLGSAENVSQWGLSKYANDDLLVVGGRKYVAPVAADAGVPDAAATDGGVPAARAEFAVIRVKGDTGAVDTTFGPSGDGVFSLAFPTNVNPKTATILANGSAIVCGYTNFGGNKPIVFKLTAAGALDTAFATGGVYFPESGIPGFGAGGGGEAYAAVLQGDKIVTAGYGRETDQQPANGWLSFRFLANGTLDTTYGNGGHVLIPVNGQPSNARNAVVLPDQRIVLVGGGSPPKPSGVTVTQSQYAGIVFLTPNGALDPSNASGPRLYDLGGPATGRASHHFWGLALAPDSKNVVAVGIKGSVTANADAGVTGGTDEAAFLSLPTGL